MLFRALLTSLLLNKWIKKSFKTVKIGILLWLSCMWKNYVWFIAEMIFKVGLKIFDYWLLRKFIKIFVLTININTCKTSDVLSISAVLTRSINGQPFYVLTNKSKSSNWNKFGKRISFQLWRSTTLNFKFV